MVDMQKSKIQDEIASTSVIKLYSMWLHEVASTDNLNHLEKHHL